ncbi:MAG: excisionase family DNA-binding protein [Bacteroidales bacterium]|jgi:excisionase family DNA binding protein|nr:excisionase family DNA-binding protein [Bacteroidales bacterium]
MKSEFKASNGGFVMQRHDIEKWASMNELLEYLDVSREAVLRWISHRNMPAHKVGRLWKFKFSEVDEWIRSGGADERDMNKDTKMEDTPNG